MLHQELAKKYSLCSHCFYRQLGGLKKSNRSKSLNKRRGRTRSTSDDSCYICHGIMSQLDSIAERISIAVQHSEYDFDSFLLGATLPSATFEREDTIRAKFKIRGRQNIKKQFIDMLRQNFKKISGKKLEYIAQDVTINVAIINDQNISSPTISVKSSPIFLIGRYVKTQRGLFQKKQKCENCAGNRCGSCSYLGTSSLNSVEAIIASRILEISHGENPKFTWIGGEDKDSLVLGKGRPFVVRISNPKVRSFRRDLIVEGNGVRAIMRKVRQHGPSILHDHFVTKTRITIQTTEGSLRDINLLKLLNVLENSQVTFKAKSKIVKKKIYSIKVNQIDDNKFVMTITADGGLLIKQFVGGLQYMEPNVSKIIGIKCECIAFDILDVYSHSHHL